MCDVPTPMANRSSNRPRVTISITSPSETDQPLITLDLPADLTLRDLKAFIEAENPNCPAAAQILFYNGMPLSNDSQTLEQAGVRDNEMMAVHIRQHGNVQPQSRPRQTRQQAAGGVPPPDPEDVRQQLLRSPPTLEQLTRQKPELAALVNDPVQWRTAYNQMQREQEQARREQERQIQLLNEDPFNIEAQRKIEEIIRQDRVIENLHTAYDLNPEVFASVHMLYISTEVNGVPVKAFVDSGAQATIMSPSCAERCGIMRLLDTRYAGIARGVGTAAILGRVHHAVIKIGGVDMPCAFTVMEGKDVDLLFGLDMLKKYRAKIDLEKNALCFADTEVPFLPEHEIPRGFGADEPTVPGPGNTEIGTKTGAVKQAGAGESSVAVGEAEKQPVSQSAGPAQPQPASAPTSSSQWPEEHIQQLMSITSVPREVAINALSAANGNLDAAAGMLIGN
ncbi:DNA damage-inducible protein 1 [Paraconiothyrium brasiliense]|uniref:DNA damage-inducible protein 1 n=1 Tax=Paraconiothyrium brasiliense TaxID=300254 RepID=A0ABR3QJD0_9PLEO